MILRTFYLLFFYIFLKPIKNKFITKTSLFYDKGNYLEKKMKKKTINKQNAGNAGLKLSGDHINELFF